MDRMTGVFLIGLAPLWALGVVTAMERYWNRREVKRWVRSMERYQRSWESLDQLLSNGEDTTP